MPTLNVKRLFLEGIKIKRECPNCKKMVVVDLGEQYLSYPDFNIEEFNAFGIYCRKCDHEFDVEYKLHIKLEIKGES